MDGNMIGYIVSGSLKDGFIARLTVPAWQVQEGSFVVVESGTYKFYGLVTDIRLGATDPRFAEEQSEMRLPAELAMLLHGQTLYTELLILPALMLDVGLDPGVEDYDPTKKPERSEPMPVKTLPAHHALTRRANAFDISEIFGDPGRSGFFEIGKTREQGHPVSINLEKFIQRSSGIFGATGTGKSYLTRLILAGLIHSGSTSVLVFDMHDEYSYGDTSPDTNLHVPGLKDKLGSKVRVCALGKGTKIHGHQPDFDLVLSYSDILPEDILMLSGELNLRETTATTLSALVREFGTTQWFASFMKLKGGDGEGSVIEWAKSVGVNESAAEALYNKLGRVFSKPYLQNSVPVPVVKNIIDTLKNGASLILSFGKFENDLDYLLVTNILTRKIREEWENMTNDYRVKNGTQPKPLVIAVEEAHKLLNREMANQTTFSLIAREMRKYYVTLLIIDQRPSQIYDEVMSQLGTRISGWLGDDADISAVLSGLAGKDALRGMLARLQAKQEVLLLGWGVPMPLPVSSRRYDDQFWKELLGKDQAPPVPSSGQPDWMFD